MLRILLAFILCLAAPAAAGAAPFRSARITVESSGPATGGDVVLIPGLGSTPAVWRGTARALERDHRVHVVGLRGFGPGDPGANATGPLSDPAAAEIVRFLAAEGIGAGARPPAALIGHSLGGQIALMTALRAPERVGRLMLVDSLPFFPALLDPAATSADMAALAEIARAGVLLLGDGALSTALNSQAGALGQAGGLLAGFRVGQNDRAVLAQGLYEVMTTDLRPYLRQVRAPATVLFAYTRATNVSQQQVDTLFATAFADLPDARFQRMDDSSHSIMADQPAAFLRAVGRFLGDPAPVAAR